MEENIEELFPEERRSPQAPPAADRRRYESFYPEVSRLGEQEQYETGPLEKLEEDRSYERERRAAAPAASRGRRRKASQSRGPEGEERLSDYPGWGDAYEEEAPESQPRRGDAWGEEETERSRGLSSRYDEDQVTGRRGTGSFGGDGSIWEELDDVEDLEPGHRRRGASFEEEEDEEQRCEPGPERYPHERRGAERRSPTPRRRAQQAPERFSRSAPRGGRGAGGGRGGSR